MKTIKLPIMFALVAFCAISCKKEYDCSCTTTETWVQQPTMQNPNSSTQTQTKTESRAIDGKLTRKQAQSICVSETGTGNVIVNSSYTYSGTTYYDSYSYTTNITKDCKLK